MRYIMKTCTARNLFKVKKESCVNQVVVLYKFVLNYLNFNKLINGDIGLWDQLDFMLLMLLSNTVLTH